MAERKQYALLDVLKFLLISIIMFSHTANEHAHLTGIWHYVLSLYNFGVPFCFACSGFLFFSKARTLSREEQDEYYKKNSIRLGKMYFAWSVIYLCFIFATWARYGTTSEEVLDSVHRWVVYSTYPTIWFLPALWIGISATYLLWRNFKLKTLFIVVTILFVFGNLMGSYENLMKSNAFVASLHDAYITVFKSFRNGVFNGIPYVAIGMLVAKKQNTWPAWSNLLFTIFFSISVVGECVLIKVFHLSTMNDMVFMLAPAIYFLLSWAIKAEIKSNSLFIWMRNMSMPVFLGQRIFLTAIPGVSHVYKLWCESMSQLEIMIVLPIMVILFSFAVIVLSKRIPLLKVLW